MRIMVSYHTPKVYRSPFGCCICRAKSSSSRFTDSSRYESEFFACFKLEEPRYGEICNACVLLIKRWKKLPPGTKRNWHHVVDARARPRGRSAARQDAGHNSSLEAQLEKSPWDLKRIKHKYIRKSEREGSSYYCEDQGFIEDRLSEISGNSVPSSRAPSPFMEYDASSTRHGSSKRKQQRPIRRNFKDYAEFIDYDYWTKEKVCCGYIFKGPCGELLVNPQLFKPCCPIDTTERITSPTNTTTIRVSCPDDMKFNCITYTSDAVSNCVSSPIDMTRYHVTSPVDMTRYHVTSPVDMTRYHVTSPVDMTSDRVTSPEESEHNSGSVTTLSDGGSLYEDELRSPYDEVSAGESFYQSSSSRQTIDATLLTELATALVT